MKIVVATNNDYKINEIREVISSGIELVSLQNIGINDDIPENENSIEGNALAKARFVYDLTRKPVFSDDTGLEVSALNMQPGVMSARYAGKQKNQDSNLDLLLKNLKNCSDRSARFRTVVALILNGEEHLFEGIVEGSIAMEQSGCKGFGYDPVFIPKGFAITFAEMNLDQKNAISHRAKAIKKLNMFLNSLKSNNLNYQ